MMKNLRKLALMAIMTGLISAGAFAQTATIPVIDGDGTDAAWDQAMTWPLEAIIDVSSVVDAADFSGDVAVLWSADSIYVRVNVIDDDLHYVSGGSDYNYDNVCIYFDVFNKATGEYVDTTQMYFEKNWWAELTQMGGRFSPGWSGTPPGNFAVDTADGKTGYTIELAVGWDEIDKVPMVGDKVGFDVKISDNDDDGVDDGDGRDQLAWRDVTDGGWNDPSLWGEITLAADGSVSGQTDFVPTTDGMGDERAWAIVPAWGLDAVIDNSSITNAADFSGNVKLMWTADSLYTLVTVADDDLHYLSGGSDYNYDNVCIYFDVFNKATGEYVDTTQMYFEKNWWAELTQMGGRFSPGWSGTPPGNFAVDTMDGATGYVIELAVGWDEIDKAPVVGDVMGFDVKISDNDDDGVDDGDGRDQLAWSDVTDGGWNDPSVWGEITLAENGMVSGQTVFTPITDGDASDRAWVDAVEMPLKRSYAHTGVTDDADFSGTVKALWDPDNFYVLLEVNDDSLYVGTPEDWKKDHYTVYFDVSNLKTTSYVTDNTPPMDSAQFNFEKPWTDPRDFYFAGDTVVQGVDFVEVINSGTGYVMEMTVPMSRFGVTLESGQVMGWDAKIGDNDGGAEIDGMFSWNQLEDQGYQNPSFLGEITLMADGTIMGEPEVPNSAPVIDVIANVDVDMAATADVTVSVTDADEDAVTISAVSGDEAIATVAVTDAVITVTGVAAGTATITVSATDGEDPAEDVTFDVMVVDPTVGIKEVSTGFNMYPNPANSMFTLSSAAEITSVSISNVTGQLVYSSAVNGFSADVNISEFEAGMYIVSVKFESMEVSNRVLIKE